MNVKEGIKQTAIGVLEAEAEVLAQVEGEIQAALALITPTGNTGNKNKIKLAPPTMIYDT